MTTIKYTFGGARITLNIEPVEEGRTVDPRLASDLSSFLSIIEKAYSYQQGHVFSRLQAAFLEEVDGYFDDQFVSREDIGERGELTEEDEKFIQEHLPESVRKNLRLIGKLTRKK